MVDIKIKKLVHYWEWVWRWQDIEWKWHCLKWNANEKKWVRTIEKKLSRIMDIYRYDKHEQRSKWSAMREYVWK